MQSTPWLSILIPIYNVEAYLEDCLNSILNQCTTGIEIIAVDDCSTDGSLALLQRLTKNLSLPIRLLQHSHNQGLSAARNTLIDNAKGDYLWFLDSDDALNPNAIEACKTIIEKHSPDIILCDFNIWREKQKFKHILRGENHVASFIGPKNKLCDQPITLFEGIYKAGQLHSWSKISKRNLWQHGLRFPVGKLFEDMTTTPRLLLEAKNFYYAPLPWVAYRHRPGSILRTHNSKKTEDCVAANEGILTLWQKKHPNLPANAQFYFSYFCIKIFIDARKEYRQQEKLNPTAFNKNKIEHLKNQLLKQTLSTPKIFFYHHLTKGWWFRLLRFAKNYYF